MGLVSRALTLSSPSSLYTIHPAFNDTTDDKDEAIDGKPLAKGAGGYASSSAT
jgi:hypothetical protein